MANTDPNTGTTINNIIEADSQKRTALKLLAKCKQQDKGKKEYPVPGSPVKTWFVTKTKAQAEKRIEKFKKSLIVKI